LELSLLAYLYVTWILMSVNKLRCLNNLKFCKDLYFAVYCQESYDGVSLLFRRLIFQLTWWVV